MIGLCHHYYAVKCAAVQYFVVHPMYIILVGGSFITRTRVFSSALWAPNAHGQRPEGEQRKLRSAAACSSACRNHDLLSQLLAARKRWNSQPWESAFGPRPLQEFLQ